MKEDSRKDLKEKYNLGGLEVGQLLSHATKFFFPVHPIQ